MIRSEVVVIGAGEIGRGWATLAAARGLAVVLHDVDPRALKWARHDVAARVERLVSLGRAAPASAGEGLTNLRTTSDLADAVVQATRVVEATPEELTPKRELFARVEALAPADALLLSSSSGFHASRLGALMRRPERLVVAHPLHPVELIPVVEVVPGPMTDQALVRQTVEFLERLGQLPIVLRKEIEGNAVGRITAAVWREAIHLVLDGVLDPGELDRLVASGPALGWAAAGPHLTYHLAASDAGIRGFLDHLLPTFEQWWKALAGWDTLSEAGREELIRRIEGDYGKDIKRLAEERDRVLGKVGNKVNELRDRGREQ
ncbi:MAG: 3-hydroxyacyl-CoA dehydrogenase NAD-binding domain-containing protein [Gemmatimonadota bacterium]